MTTLHLRDAQTSEQDAIRELTLAAYQEYASVMGERWQFYRQNILATLADFGPAAQIVATRNDQLLGTVLLFPGDTSFKRGDGTALVLKWPEIRLLAVTPSARGQGVGLALMEECLRRAQATGVEQITLHTTDMMQVAMRMYERRGFVRAPELDWQPAPDITIKGYRYPLTANVA